MLHLPWLNDRRKNEDLMIVDYPHLDKHGCPITISFPGSCKPSVILRRLTMEEILLNQVRTTPSSSLSLFALN